MADAAEIKNADEQAAHQKNQELKARPIPRITIQCFCENDDSAGVLQTVSEDRRLMKTHVNIQSGGIEAGIAYFANSPTPNLIVLESSKTRDAMLADLDKLAESCDPGTKVIIVGHYNDVLLYRELLERGVSEYIVAPIEPVQVMEAISNLFSEPGAKPVGQSAAFIGAKGGIGSSTICHNVGWAISETLKSEVVITDFDLPFGTLGLDFNQDPIRGIADALFAPERLDEVLLDRLLVKCSEHLSILTSPGTLDREYDLGEEACEKVLEIIRLNIPYAVMDLPHVWTKWSKMMLLQADEIVVTCAPDLANLRNAKNLIDLIRGYRKNDNPPYLVLNQVGMPKRPEISVKDFAEAIEIEPSAVIQFDPESFGMAANNGQMIEEINNKAKSAVQFKELARMLTHQNTETEASGKGSLLSPLLGRLGKK
ncbi:MAG: CtpF protein [Methyloligellaceae bacterium]